MLSFKAVLGNTRLVQHLQYTIERAQIPHAMIIAGAVGLGKMTLAKTYAKAILCEAHCAEPCGKCPSCIRFESGNHPDVLYVTPTKTKAIGVEDIREQITQNMITKPYEYPYKIFIMAHSDTMTVAAQNALLKTIEEPASFGIFILLAEHTGFFLPTILSRCITYKMLAVSHDVAMQYVADHTGISTADAMVYAMYAQGNIGRAMMLAHDVEFIALRELALQTAMHMPTRDLMQIFAYEKQLGNYKDRMQDALDMLYFWYRDILVCKEAGETALLIQLDKKLQIEQESRRLPLKKILACLDAVWEAKRQLRLHANVQLTLEILLLRLN